MPASVLYLRVLHSGVSVKVASAWVKIARSREIGLRSTDVSRQGCEVRVVEGRLQGRATTRVFVKRHALSTLQAARFDNGQEFDMASGDTLFITKLLDECALVLQVRNVRLMCRTQLACMQVARLPGTAEVGMSAWRAQTC